MEAYWIIGLISAGIGVLGYIGLARSTCRICNDQTDGCSNCNSNGRV